jgi:hypothetical protein
MRLPATGKPSHVETGCRRNRTSPAIEPTRTPPVPSQANPPARVALDGHRGERRTAADRPGQEQPRHRVAPERRAPEQVGQEPIAFETRRQGDAAADRRRCDGEIDAEELDAGFAVDAATFAV